MKPLFGEHLRVATDPKKVAERLRLESSMEERLRRIRLRTYRVSRKASHGKLGAEEKKEFLQLRAEFDRDMARLNGTSRFEGLLGLLFQ